MGPAIAAPVPAARTLRTGQGPPGELLRGIVGDVRLFRGIGLMAASLSRRPSRLAGSCGAHSGELDRCLSIHSLLIIKIPIVSMLSALSKTR